ncbi:EI24 domain-containing protein [Kordiimonas gwangyangensis]|uniref:EI24 domain-containing protein n=1 Tax=Kordiimonas gwangyangensis TaxID=288022 RepID=UPI000361F50B|nr:EI24 domain-containing protein [Kordiimonas gwangyangensis]
MIGQALNRTWQQLLHPKFRSVFFTGVLVAFGTLAGLIYLLNIYWPQDFSFGYSWLEWLDEFGFWSVAIIGSYILFPAISTTVMGFLTDKIALAVEEEYYPNRIGSRKVSGLEVVLGSLQLMAMVIIINLIALIPYILLIFTIGGTFLLFVAVNGLLLGREYFEMVAIRHMDAREVRRFRKRYSGKIFIGGAMIAVLFAIPFVNILAPIVGTAMMTHIYHNLASGRA